MAASNSNASAFSQSVTGPTLESLYGTQSPETTKQISKYWSKKLPANLGGAQISDYTKEIYANGLQGMDVAGEIVPGNPALSPPTSATPETPAAPQNPGWTFITAPEDVSWDIANAATRVDMFGTNNPPVVAGSRGMRDLTLSNSLVEGFMRGVTIEGKVQALENLMNYGLNRSDGFVSVPVYQVWAQEKQYGGPQGYFIIKDVKVKEVMRDTAGWATRAYVDISLMQVPAYQVNSGRDQASATTSGAKSALISAANARNIQQQANQNVAGTAANGGSTGANATPNSGAGTGQPPTPQAQEGGADRYKLPSVSGRQ